MINEIQNTKAFKKLLGFQQKLLLRRDNRLTIQDAVITAKAIGIENWNPPGSMPPHWQAIVKELVTKSNSNEQT
jgi:hypothetical protein